MQLLDKVTKYNREQKLFALSQGIKNRNYFDTTFNKHFVLKVFVHTSYGYSNLARRVLSLEWCRTKFSEKCFHWALILPDTLHIKKSVWYIYKCLKLHISITDFYRSKCCVTLQTTDVFEDILTVCLLSDSLKMQFWDWKFFSSSVANLS